VTTLNGSTDRIGLGREVFVQGPGLMGTVELLAPTLLGARGGEQPATPTLTSALERHQFTTVQSLEINAQRMVASAAPAKRGPDDRLVLTLEVPEIAADQPQVVLLADEDGIVTWHFPKPALRPRTVRFEVPAETLTAAPAGPADRQRGLVTMVGKKLLSVLVFPILEAGAGLLAKQLAHGWENRHRPPLLRRFKGPDDAVTPTVLDEDGLRLLAGGRALLFIHGTCSSSQGGFGALPADVWSALRERYGGRLFAYDHPTLSVDPLENAETLRQLVTADLRLDVDVVAHSRGGLVARAIACAGVDDTFPLRVNKIVHVGVPNAGTALANVERYSQFIDRVSTMLNLLPDGPLSVVADVLDGLLTLVKIIGCNGIGELPGLHIMDPTYDWLAALGSREVPPLIAYAIDSDFEPVGGLLKLVRVENGLVDRVFGDAGNDMVVPSEGVHETDPLLHFATIPEERRLSFGRDESIWHCAYFGSRKTGTKLLDWLTG
jgi:pimeloyl-ACP methyl ester carboxylesterase